MVVASSAHTAWIKDILPAENIITTDPYYFNKLYYDTVSYASINNIRFDAVITFYEHAVLQTSLLGAALGLLHTPLEAVLNSSINKINMRDTLVKAGLSKITFAASNKSDLLKDIGTFPKPCIIKPLFGSDSYGVRKINDASEIPAYIDQFTKELTTDKESSFLYKSDVLLVEEYIEGRLFSVDGLVANGNIVCLDPIEVFSSPEPYFAQYENRFPSSLNDVQVKAVKNHVTSCLSALKFDNTAYHAEVKVKDNNQIEIIEIAARAPGGQLMAAHKIIHNFDFVLKILDLHLGTNAHPESFPCNTKCALIQKGVFSANGGTLKALEGTENSLSITELIRFVQVTEAGDRIKTYPDDYPVPLYFYELTGNDLEALKEISQEIERNIVVSVI